MKKILIIMFACMSWYSYGSVEDCAFYRSHNRNPNVYCECLLTSVMHQVDYGIGHDMRKQLAGCAELIDGKYGNGTFGDLMQCPTTPDEQPNEQCKEALSKIGK